MIQNNVAVLFINGQSNAHAHAQKMKVEDIINIPLNNVFTLKRNLNQSFNLTDVKWSNFTSEGYNLAETQDNTYSFACNFAKIWQQKINDGEKLPDLYIVQISIGSQGIVCGMWNKDKQDVLIPGELGTVDISLFSFSKKINQLVLKNLKQNGKKPKVIGWHWLGSESDATKWGYANKDFAERYDYFFDEMVKSMGNNIPIYLYKLSCFTCCHEGGLTTDGINIVNDNLLRQKERFNDLTIVETDKCPFFDNSKTDLGIFNKDKIHYLPKTHIWFAEHFYQICKERYFINNKWLF